MKRMSIGVIGCIVAASLSALPCHGQVDPAKSANTVNIFFTVADSSSSAPDLTKDSLQLKEDGRPQTIQHFEKSADMPLTVGILLDTSGSMQAVVPAEKAAASEFLRKLVREQDLAFVMSFDITVDLLQDLTSDLHLLHSGLERAKVNVGLRPNRAPGHLHDAVYLAADEVLRKQVGRKALVILTTGEDFGSKVKLKDAIQAAQRADAVCYVVMFFRPLFGANVTDVAEQTGGRLFTIRSADKLQESLTQITNELHNQYRLSYVSDNDRRDGSFRSIEITAKEGQKIRARKGYFAPAQ